MQWAGDAADIGDRLPFRLGAKNQRQDRRQPPRALGPAAGSDTLHRPREKIAHRNVDNTR